MPKRGARAPRPSGVQAEATRTLRTGCRMRAAVTAVTALGGAAAPLNEPVRLGPGPRSRGRAGSGQVARPAQRSAPRPVRRNDFRPGGALSPANAAPEKVPVVPGVAAWGGARSVGGAGGWELGQGWRSAAALGGQPRWLRAGLQVLWKGGGGAALDAIAQRAPWAPAAGLCSARPGTREAHAGCLPGGRVALGRVRTTRRPDAGEEEVRVRAGRFLRAAGPSKPARPPA